jgi:pyruvate dehydrogenase E2 component (dihydrolipoamide acetyltransferase)
VEVLVPDLGDFDDVEIVDVLVKPGDDVETDSPLLTIETDKAAMDVPSPAAGKVTELKVSVGDRVSTGDLIAILEAGAGTAAGPGPSAAEGAPREHLPEAPAAETVKLKRPQTNDEAALEPVLVPDLGDFEDVEVVELLVKAGTHVEPEQGLLTLETDKASMDVPSPKSGTIVEMKVAVGDRVSAGDAVALLRAEVEEAPAPQDRPAAADAPDIEPAEAVSEVEPAPAARRERRELPRIDEASFGRAHASPSVRKLGRELGVDLGLVSGSGRKNRVTAEDVKAFVKQIMLGGAVQGPGAALPRLPEVDFGKFGDVELKPLSRIQRISGPRLHASWVNVPHVTQHDLADITALEAKRQALKAEATEKGIRLTLLAFVVRACSLLLEEFSVFRSSLSADGENLVIKHYTHIGFAADTPNGLVVPVLRDADAKTVLELAQELGALSGAAREGKLGAAQMQGGVFTISSLGGIGGTSFTPIINAPEVAILGLSRSRMQPVYREGGFIPRLMLPLSLSYDHRVIDGAQAVRFTTRLGELLGDVERLLEGPS